VRAPRRCLPLSNATRMRWLCSHCRPTRLPFMQHRERLLGPGDAVSDRAPRPLLRARRRACACCRAPAAGSFEGPAAARASTEAPRARAAMGKACGRELPHEISPRRPGDQP
jgi:hypothetical protein